MMKTTKFAIVGTAFAAMLIWNFVAAAQVYVNPYTRSDGTQVEGHYRSAPDSNPYNNYSYPGNVNPYTGKEATGNPDTYLNHEHNNSLGSDPYHSRSHSNGLNGERE